MGFTPKCAKNAHKLLLFLRCEIRVRQYSDKIMGVRNEKTKFPLIQCEYATELSSLSEVS